MIRLVIHDTILSHKLSNVNRFETIHQIIQKLVSIFVHYVNRREPINLIYFNQDKGREHYKVLRYKAMTRYEILANNGQVLEHGFTSQKQALARISAYKKLYPSDVFKIREYRIGKYGNE